ncbi:MAG TPA: NAD kinase [Burkholderiaceae bacterium]|jgi:NAD+ kinase|nr:NAD kinase [Burkholderiaceae bacterium]HPE00555.1 NAD kinase [Burkholderiaceae bacterium]HRZ00472.1 NAD kinase [Burkholderiaceae bacterium]
MPAPAPAARPFRSVAIFGKRAETVAEPLARLLTIVESAGVRAMLEASTAERLGGSSRGYTLAEIGREADLAIVLGGDGTMLGIARELAPYGLPLIGVNHGRLGFITDVPLDGMETRLPAMLAGEYETETRTMLDAAIERDGVRAFEARAVNDVVISRGVAGGMVEFTVRVDGVTMYNQRADGVILATPTGSTAYALSADGPILHPRLAGLVLVPVAPQTLSNRPIVLPDDVAIEIEITDVRDASAHFDMQSFTNLAPGDVLRARRAREVVTLLHPLGHNHFDTLRQKLHWNVMPSEPATRG